MAILDEEKIKAYHVKEGSGWVCPVCAVGKDMFEPEE